MKQVYLVTYPTGKIYVGKDAIGSCRYFGCPNMDIVNADFRTLPDHVRRDYTVRKQILWESETATDAEMAIKEVEFIRRYQSHNPTIGYNRWPKFIPPAVSECLEKEPEAGSDGAVQQTNMQPAAGSAGFTLGRQLPAAAD